MRTIKNTGIRGGTAAECGRGPDASLDSRRQRRFLQRPSLRWIVSDVTVTVVIAVASGVVFWGVDLIYSPVSSLFQVVPGLNALLDGLYYFAGPLAMLIVRKPGAALFSELVAAFVEAILGSLWGGMGTLLPGLAQGLGAELAFLIFCYRFWNVGVTVFSGGLAALGGSLVAWPLYYVGSGIGFLAVTFVCSIVSGMVLSGALMWYLYRAIAKTGAIDRLSGGSVRGSAPKSDGR